MQKYVYSTESMKSCLFIDRKSWSDHLCLCNFYLPTVHFICHDNHIESKTRTSPFWCSFLLCIPACSQFDLLCGLVQQKNPESKADTLEATPSREVGPPIDLYIHPWWPTIIRYYFTGHCRQHILLNSSHIYQISTNIYKVHDLCN